MPDLQALKDQLSCSISAARRLLICESGLTHPFYHTILNVRMLDFFTVISAASLSLNIRPNLPSKRRQ